MNPVYALGACACCVCIIAITALIVGSIALSEINHIKGDLPQAASVANTPKPIVGNSAAAFPMDNKRVNLQSASLRSALLKNAQKKEEKRSVAIDDKLPELVDAVPDNVRLQNKKPAAPRALTLRERLARNKQ